VTPGSNRGRRRGHAHCRRRRTRLIAFIFVFALFLVGVVLPLLAWALRERAHAPRQEEVLKKKPRKSGPRWKRRLGRIGLPAEEKLRNGRDAEAIAYLARADRYVPESSLAAEAAIPIVLSSPIQHSMATLQGHTHAVNSAVFSPDGSCVLTVSDDVKSVEN
jgi:hypothetical protein